MTAPTKDAWKCNDDLSLTAEILNDTNKMIKDLGGIPNPFLPNNVDDAMIDVFTDNSHHEFAVFVTPKVEEILTHPFPCHTHIIKWNWWERLKFRWHSFFHKHHLKR